MKEKSKYNIKITILFLLIYVVCTAICFLLDYFKLNNLNFIMIYILGVLFVAIFSDGYIVSLIFSLVSVFGFNFWFTTPRLSFAVFDLTYIVTFFLMFAISMTVSKMTYNLKKKLNEINELNKEKFRIEKETESEKNKATMLRSISHDLRTPLTSISSGAELLLSNNHLNEEDHRSILEGVLEKSNWTIRLIENLLFLTRVESSNLVVAKESEAIEEIIPFAVRNISTIKGNREIIIEIPKELLLVPMDTTLIIQLLSNLLNNAVKFTKDDGKIKIQVFNAINEVVFRIYNNGKKLEEENLTKIFDLYYSNSDRSSTGIGLSVCKAIIGAHNGKICARNTEDGVVFEFTLPLGE